MLIKKITEATVVAQDKQGLKVPNRAISTRIGKGDEIVLITFKFLERNDHVTLINPI